MKHFTTPFLSAIFFFLGTIFTYAQYTETINSNRPGASQGAFSVGKGVLQLEAGGYLGNDNHNLRGSDTDVLGADYALRYGFLFEALEVSLTGSFESQNAVIKIGGTNEEFQTSNFKTNTLGVKYLVFDPYKNAEPDKPNLYSWKANQRFKWKTLIPAVAVFAGANFYMADNPYLYEGEGRFSPKFILSTQNNWRGGWVFVTNFILDKISEPSPTYAGIFTLTHAFTPKFAGILEYQGIISDIYADDLARTGLAYLLGDNFQVDLSGLINFKNTPSRWQVAAGLSYRWDFHSSDEFLEESNEGDLRQKKKKEPEVIEPEIEN